MRMSYTTGTGASLRSGESARAGPHRRVAFWLAGATLTLFNAAVSAPSPLYAIYQAKFGFSATVLTVIFAVYVVAVLAAVLPAGQLSDQIGRRPVIFFGLALQIVAMAVFLIADEVGLLLIARILQGISVGVIIGALSALLVDLQSRGSALGPLVRASGHRSGSPRAPCSPESSSNTHRARYARFTGFYWRCSRWPLSRS
jgi:predicted MFS family arabinose efflux permease